HQRLTQFCRRWRENARTKCTVGTAHEWIPLDAVLLARRSTPISFDARTDSQGLKAFHEAAGESWQALRALKFPSFNILDSVTSSQGIALEERIHEKDEEDQKHNGPHNEHTKLTSPTIKFCFRSSGRQASGRDHRASSGVW